MKNYATSCASIAALAMAMLSTGSPLLAQEAPQSGGSATASIADIVVTGTRLRTTGYDAPTPTQVISQVDIQRAAPKMIDDFLNQVPSISGSMTLRARAVQASNGTNGISSPSLRSIGTNRTLVLLDGQRSVSVTQTGETDVLSFPSQLIQRVDVVTGGASALYGSDALAGVVNFILDKEYEGLKIEAQGGITTYGDDENYKFAGTYGTKFAGGRGHFVASAEYQWNKGIGRDFDRLRNGRGPKRDWEYGAPQLINNPAYNAVTNPTVPQFISSFNGTSNAGPAGSTPGGLINNCLSAASAIVPCGLKGTAFTNAGAPYAFNYGQVDANNPNLFMIGGDWRNSDVNALTGLDPAFHRVNVFTRADFDLTDKINVFAQFMHSSSKTYGNFNTRVWQGAASGPTSPQTGSLILRSDNAYLRQALANDPARLAMLNSVDAVSFGTVSEAEALGGRVKRKFDRFVVGGKGEFDLGSQNYNWNFYYQHGRSHAHETIPGSHRVANLVRAIDAVVNPANGQIVCRSTLTDPTNGCAPLNLIGFDGVIDPGALAYVYGAPSRDHIFTQDVVSFDVAGEPFDLWAGPVSIAFGGEHRREKLKGKVDPLSVAGTASTNPAVNNVSGWSTNLVATNGSYHVTEGFLEVSVPLLKDSAVGKSLKIDGAVRATQYSTSGYVTTWKAGLIYEPVDGIRLRMSQSRDIRAASLGELYTKGLFITSAVQETAVVNGTPTTFNYPQNIAFTTGNAALDPEKADTTGIGLVVQPTGLPGFSFSADWYRIKIKDAVGLVAVQAIVAQCNAGNTLFCPAIFRANGSTGAAGPGLTAPPSPITQVNNTYFNLASQEFSGIDFEASYRRELLGGNWSIHGFATRYIKARSNDGLTPPIDFIGALGQSNSTPNIGSLPKWKYRVTTTFDADLFALTLTGRGSSAGTWDAPGVAFNVECSTNCPTTLPVGYTRTVDNNRAPAAFYVDTTVTLKPKIGGYDTEFFFNVTNLFNKDPAIQPRGPGGLAGSVPSNSLIYDTLGRTFSVGLRAKF